VRFLNKQSLKHIIFFAVFSALMINTHFFGLFVLASQIIILSLYLFFVVEREARKGFFKHCIIAGVILVILFLPSIPILLNISEINSFWIKPPSKIFFKSMFYSFFGNSEFLIYIAELLLVIFYLKVLLDKHSNQQTKDNKIVNSFNILTLWLFVTFMIPYFRSYASVPMLINRYFISALPAIIIIVAIGYIQIKHKVVYFIIGFIFVISSFVDLFVVKDYYHRITKTQFREVTKEVKLKNTDNHPIVYRKAWHMEHFFGDSTKLINSELDNYINKNKIKNNNHESFWAIGAHSRPFQVTKANEQFLNENYYLIDEIEYFDCWARFYVYKDKKNLVKLNLNGFSPKLLKKESGILFKSNVTISSKQIFLKKGLYRLALRTKSEPEIPINNENAHLDISINGERLGGFFTSSKKIETTLFEFEITNGKEIEIQLTFDNDYFNTQKDRDLIVYEVTIENIKK